MLIEGVRAKIYFQASVKDINDQQHLQLEDLKMDFSVRNLQMGIKNVHNGNAILGKCILFLRKVEIYFIIIYI